MNICRTSALFILATLRACPMERNRWRRLRDTRLRTRDSSGSTEEGWVDNEVARTIAETYLKDLQSRIDTLVLGCTHYPILRRVIQDAIGADVNLIDSGEATAAEVKALLKEKELARLTPATGALDRRLCDDLDHFYVTDAAERFARVAERFLGSKPLRLEAVEVWGDDRLRT